MKLKYSWLIFLAVAAATSLSAAEITASPSPATSSIVGDWVGDGGREGTISLGFKADGTLLWMVQDEKSTMSTLAKYRLNPSTNPPSVEAFDFEEGPLKGGRLHGSFEFQSDGRLKLEFDDKAPPKEFTKDAVVFSKATSPIVLPNKPADTSKKTPDVSPPGTATTGSLIAGDWTSTPPGGGIVSFSFKEDGSVLFVTENPGSTLSARGKYRLDPSTKPQSIELFDFADGPMKGEHLRGIFEFQSDGHLKLDFLKDAKAPPLKEFTKEALVFSKGATPVLPSNKPAQTPDVAPGPSSDEKFFAEGQTLYERKEYDGAIAAYTKAISLNPKSAVAYHHRGMCFVIKGDKDAAIADYEKAMELDPSFSEILKPLVISLRANRSAERERTEARTSPPEATPTAKSKP